MEIDLGCRIWKSCGGQRDRGTDEKWIINIKGTKLDSKGEAKEIQKL